MSVACMSLAACAEEPASPPTTPPPAVQQAPLRAAPPAPRPVEVLRVSARRIRGDAELTRLAGPALLAQAKEPVAIEVQTEQPLGHLARASSPEIFINGRRVGDTRAVPPDRLYVFLPDGSGLEDVNAVTVAWLGNEPLTRSTRPATLTRQMIP
ncbi:hypothetical protein D7Y21_21240 [Corallococcus sp. AB045]|nr:hypothetical protein D7Y21_21240 [Corallococcus sp. AB045]